MFMVITPRKTVFIYDGGVSVYVAVSKWDLE
jgi:hypothetical protein